MKYAMIAKLKDGSERVARTLPLAMVPLWDPDSPLPGTAAVPDEVEVGWIMDVDGWAPPPPPTLEQLQKKFEAAVQKRLDAFAQTRGYDSILSACTYATSANPKFRAEGQYAAGARDDTWAAWHGVLGSVTEGRRPLPPLEDVLAELPALAWPEGGGDG